MRGYFGIGVYGMKTEVNYGTLFRSAMIFGASFIFLIGRRFKKQSSDTMASSRHIPLYEYTSFADFQNHRPHDCRLIGVEMSRNAIPISDFVHPQKAIYLLGAEDKGLPEFIIEQCQTIIVLPGKFCLNVATAGSIVMFDRINKNKLSGGL